MHLYTFTYTHFWLNGGRIRGPAHYEEGGADGLLVPSKKSDWPIKVHVDSKGITDGPWRGERKCIDPKTGNADLWIEIWEELHGLAERGIFW